MKGSTKRLISLLVSLVFLMATFFVYISFLKPAYRDVNTLRGDLQSKTTFYNEQKDLLLGVQDLLTQYTTLSAPQQTVSRALPTKEDYPTLLNQINALANISELLLDSVTIDPVSFQGKKSFIGTDVPHVQTLQLSLRLVGPYESVKRFIEVVERNFRIMDIVHITVNPGSGNNYAYDFIINTYYQSIK